MKILLFRSNNLIASRCNKYVNYYEKKNIDYIAVGWDRNCSGITKDHYDFFRYKAGVNVGGLKACFNHFRWMMFVYKYIKQNPEATTIHACDLNSAFPAALYKRINKNKPVVIFDACDWFSANFYSMKLVRKIFEWMEKFSYKNSDKLIICEPEREEQITFKIKEKPLVLPNIPQIDDMSIKGNNDKYRFSNNWPTLAYFGNFSQDRFLLEMIELTKTEKFNLLIGGFGTKRIEELCKEVNRLPNVKYFGKMTMQEGLQMTNCADISYAMYCKVSPNNIYAAPNKLYEAMFLGKPIISTKGTILEHKILENKIGYAIEENVEELRVVIKNLDKMQLKEMGQRSNNLWKTKYSNYVADFFNNTYSSLIR